MSDFMFSKSSEVDKLDPISDKFVWNVLIVDDEEDIHAVTELVLDGFEFDGRKVNFLNAYSAKEAESGNNSLSSVTKQLVKVGLDSEYDRDISDYLSKLIDSRSQRIEPPENISEEKSSIARR